MRAAGSARAEKTIEKPKREKLVDGRAKANLARKQRAQRMNQLTGAGRQALESTHSRDTVLLVKLPKMIADIWASKEPGTRLGSLRGAGLSGGDMRFTCDPVTLGMTGASASMPMPLQYDMVTHLSQKLHTEPKVGNGGMHVISQLEPPDPEGDPAVTLGPRMEGVVKSRYTLRMDKEHQSYKDYMKGLTVRGIKHETERNSASIKQKQDRRLHEKRETDWAFLREKETRRANKPERNCNVRREKKEVEADLFGLYDKQPMYRLEELIKLTTQPKAYLKEILEGLCDKILAGPNRNMYKLKEEYSQSAAMPEEPAA